MSVSALLSNALGQGKDDSSTEWLNYRTAQSNAQGHGEEGSSTANANENSTSTPAPSPNLPPASPPTDDGASSKDV